MFPMRSICSPLFLVWYVKTKACVNVVIFTLFLSVDNIVAPNTVAVIKCKNVVPNKNKKDENMNLKTDFKKWNIKTKKSKTIELMYSEEETKYYCHIYWQHEHIYYHSALERAGAKIFGNHQNHWKCNDEQLLPFARFRQSNRYPPITNWNYCICVAMYGLWFLDRPKLPNEFISFICLFVSDEVRERKRRDDVVPDVVPHVNIRYCRRCLVWSQAQQIFVFN